MQEAVLKRYFDPLSISNLLLTVDENRVYRVYKSDDRLNHARNINWDDHGSDCTSESYKEAARLFLYKLDELKSRYEEGLAAQCTAQMHAHIKAEIRAGTL